MFPRFVEVFQQDIYAKPQCLHKNNSLFQAFVLIIAVTASRVIASRVIVTVSHFQGTNLQILQCWCCLLFPSNND